MTLLLLVLAFPLRAFLRGGDGFEEVGTEAVASGGGGTAASWDCSSSDPDEDREQDLDLPADAGEMGRSPGGRN